MNIILNNNSLVRTGYVQSILENGTGLGLQLERALRRVGFNMWRADFLRMHLGLGICVLPVVPQQA